jgi:glycosyltransferase involved in cell wall biosynthesis
MRVAFYAPLKAPHHPTPSGDRLIARLLHKALADAGHRVSLASAFRSREGAGRVERQERLHRVGERLAQRLLRRYRSEPREQRPQLWFTYHLYHKAPDWLGPPVARALGIPYVLAEASLAPKQAGGAWAMGHEAARRAISGADAVFSLNANDVACLRPVVRDSRRLVSLPPFLDLADFRRCAGRAVSRALVAREFGLPVHEPWLVVAAMMRVGNKRDSYRLLADALGRIRERAWHLLIVGDGPMRADVEAAFAGFPAGRVIFAGMQSVERARWLLGACDLYVWPGVREPIGMALLEAQASGLPVVAGATPAARDIVRDGHTGCLVPLGDAGSFAEAVATLLDAPPRRQDLGRRARCVTHAEHGIGAASARLDHVLTGLVEGTWP